jgi:hypothetical protein
MRWRSWQKQETSFTAACRKFQSVSSKIEFLAQFLGSEPVPFVGSKVEMDRDETVKLLFLGIPALVLSFSLFTSAFRVGDMLLWYFREIKVR